MLREGIEYVEGNIPEEFNEYIKRRVYSAPTIRKTISNKLNNNNRNFSDNIYNGYNSLLNKLNSTGKSPSFEKQLSLSRPHTASSTVSTSKTSTPMTFNQSFSSSSSTTSKSSHIVNDTPPSPPSEKKFERITYYSDLKRPQPITDPFDILFHTYLTIYNYSYIQ